MILLHSIKVAIVNFALTYKVLLYKFIVGIFLTAVAFAILVPNLLPVIADFEGLGVFNMVNELTQKITSFDFSRQIVDESLANIMQISGDIVLNHAGSLLNTYIATAVLVLLWYFLNIFTDVAITEVLRGATELQAKFSLSTTLLSYFKTAIKYTCVSMLIFLPLDLVIIGLSISILLVAEGVLVYFAPFLASATFTILFALKFTLTSCWIPSMLESECPKVFGSLGSGIKLVKDKFGKVFSTYLMLIFFGNMLSTLITLMSFGVGAVLVSSMTIVMIKSVNLVTYYTLKGRKFYIDYDTIIVPKKLRDKENSFRFDLSCD